MKNNRNYLKKLCNRDYVFASEVEKFWFAEFSYTYLKEMERLVSINISFYDRVYGFEFIPRNSRCDTKTWHRRISSLSQYSR